MKLTVQQLTDKYGEEKISCRKEMSLVGKHFVNTFHIMFSINNMGTKTILTNTYELLVTQRLSQRIKCTTSRTEVRETGWHLIA